MKQIRLTHMTRQMAVQSVLSAPDGYYFQPPKEPTRNLEQNALLHALFSDLSKQAKLHGRTLTPHQWKVVMISGHAVATGMGADMVPGIEGEFVNIRESSAHMSVQRMTSLIEYVLAWCAENKISTAEVAA